MNKFIEQKIFGEGNIKKKSNKYFQYKAIKNDDEILVRTNNIKIWKGNPVLVLDKNHVVYLKNWQVLSIKNYFIGLYTNLVLLNREYFKVYEVKFDIEDFSEDQETLNFDFWKNIAKIQDEENMQISLD